MQAPLPSVVILEEARSMIPPPGRVFATEPLLALAHDGHHYVLKGPDPEVVFAEAAGSIITSELGLAVPEFGLCKYGPQGTVHFASRHKPVRLGLLGKIMLGSRIANPELLAEIVPLDLWLHNLDRNDLSIVGDYIDNDGTLRVFSIDYEKSRLLRGTSVIKLATINDERCWPDEALIRAVRQQGLPTAMCEKIAKLSEDAIHALLAPIALQLPTPAGFVLDLASKHLARRGSELDGLVRKLWNGK